MYITPLPPLTPLRRLIHTDKNTVMRQLPGRALFFERGRQALMAGIDYLGLPAGSTVLIPSNICRDVLVPFLLNGILVRYYARLSNGDIDMDDMLAKLDSSVSALYLYHYLGMPCPQTDAMIAFARSRNLPVIEDCAHAFLGLQNDQKLGSFGDIAIFSLWKFMPIPDGGVLIINRDGVTPEQIPVQKTGYPRAALSWSKRLLKNMSCLRNTAFPDIDRDMGTIEAITNHAPSRLSLSILDHANYPDIRDQRVENYAFWFESLPDFMTPYFDETPSGFCPYAFPFRVKNRDIQRTLYTGMAARGIIMEPPINPNFTGHPMIIDDGLPVNPDCDLVLCLPVYQGLTPAQKRYILTALILSLIHI